VSQNLRVQAGPFRFGAVLEEEEAPRTCEVFRSLLPFASRLIQARWSGFAAWIPLGHELELGLGPENATSVPLPGQILLYPGGISEVEILFPYGPTIFASVAGRLAGNHFLTVTSGEEQFAELGRRVQWEGAQDVLVELVEA
jgi:hypothetical protein